MTVRRRAIAASGSAVSRRRGLDRGKMGRRIFHASPVAMRARRAKKWFASAGQRKRHCVATEPLETRSPIRQWNAERGGEPAVGIEPTTARLRIECSTTELRWRLGRCVRTVVETTDPQGASRHALARTRTVTPCGTTPSRWRVYQFHHQGKPTCNVQTPISYQR
jgi:hypothetical protein